MATMCIQMRVYLYKMSVHLANLFCGHEQIHMYRHRYMYTYIVCVYMLYSSSVGKIFSRCLRNLASWKGSTALGRKHRSKRTRSIDCALGVKCEVSMAQFLKKVQSAARGVANTLPSVTLSGESRHGGVI